MHLNTVRYNPPINSFIDSNYSTLKKLKISTSKLIKYRRPNYQSIETVLAYA